MINFLPSPAPGDFSSRCSPRPIRASLKSSSSTSSFRRVLNSSRTSLSISPVIPSGEQFYNNDQRPNARGNPQNRYLERDLQLEPVVSNTTQDTQEEEPLDVQEVSSLWILLINSVHSKSWVNRVCGRGMYFQLMSCIPLPVNICQYDLLTDVELTAFVAQQCC